jgi:hypothetical protein
MRSRSKALIVAGVLVAGAALAFFLLSSVERAHAAGAARLPAPQPALPPPPRGALPPLPGAETIPDDPTVAPDPNQSADHNVSLPADI